MKTPSFLLISAVTTIGLAIPTPYTEARRVPFSRELTVLVSVTSGAEFAGSSDVGHDLDGSVVGLGGSTCTVSAATCKLRSVPEGPHVLAFETKTSTEKFTYRYLGTSAGTTVEVRRMSDGGLAIHPQLTNTLVVKLERLPADGSNAIPPTSTGPDAARSGPVDAYLSVVRGMEFVETGFVEDVADLSSELDGSTLHLGEASCVVKRAQCRFTSLSTGTHLSSMTIVTTAKRSEYEFQGTSAGKLVHVVPSRHGVAITPQGTAKIVFKVERRSASERGDVAQPVIPPREYASADIDQSYSAKIWMHIVDEREGVAYARAPLDGELAGVRIRLGRAVCTPRGENCKFDVLVPGKYPLLGEFRSNKKYAYSIDSEMPTEIAIIQHPLSKRPRADGWPKGVLTVTIVKKILMQEIK